MIALASGLPPLIDRNSYDVKPPSDSSETLPNLSLPGTDQTETQRDTQSPIEIFLQAKIIIARMDPCFMGSDIRLIQISRHASFVARSAVP